VAAAGRAARACGRPAGNGSGSTRTRRRGPPTKFGARREGLHRLDVPGRSDAAEVPPKRLSSRVRGGRGVHQDQVGQPFGVTAGVLHRQYSAPAVPEDRHRLQPEMAAHLVQVIHFGLDGDVGGSDAVGRPPATALIVVDDPESLGQTIQLGQQIVVVEVRPAVQHDDRKALADVAEMQPRAAGRYEPGARFHAGSLVRRRRPTAASVVQAQRPDGALVTQWRVPRALMPALCAGDGRLCSQNSRLARPGSVPGHFGRRWPKHPVLFRGKLARDVCRARSRPRTAGPRSWKCTGWCRLARARTSTRESASR
jgi:hypothetical protein